MFDLGNRKQVRRSQLGAAAVEFAFIAPLLLFMIAGIISFGRVLWYYDALAKATRDGARLVSMADLGDAAKRSAASAAAESLVGAAVSAAGLPGFDAANMVKVRCDAVECRAAAAAPTNVSVEINGYTVSVGELFPFVPPAGVDVMSVASLPLRPKTTMRYMR